METRRVPPDLPVDVSSPRRLRGRKAEAVSGLSQHYTAVPRRPGTYEPHPCPSRPLVGDDHSTQCGSASLKSVVISRSGGNASPRGTPAARARSVDAPARCPLDPLSNQSTQARWKGQRATRRRQLTPQHARQGREEKGARREGKERAVRGVSPHVAGTYGRLVRPEENPRVRECIWPTQQGRGRRRKERRARE